MRKVHVIGAGLAGLAAAVRLAEGPQQVILYEAARQAGGRCRSYFDQSLRLVIDNGNHLLLSGNHTALGFLQTIGAQDLLAEPPQAAFPFIDLATGERWSVAPNDGPLPWWIFVENRRVPGTRARDYLALLRLLTRRGDGSLDAILDTTSTLYARLWRPFFLAVLNTEPEAGSSRLAAAVVRESLAKGGNACRPLFAREGLGPTFIDPALRYLAERSVSVHLNRRLRALRLKDGRVEGLDLDDEKITLGSNDAVILAVPAPVAKDLMPGLCVPQSFRAIVNAHFKIEPPAHVPLIQGLLNATTEWLFAFPDRLSVTISGADRLIDVPRETLIEKIWAEVAQVTRIAAPLPAWQIVKEKRATFAATPAEELRRPGSKTAYSNLLLAGDWTATGLPATIEGAIRSGQRAADLCLRLPH